MSDWIDVTRTMANDIILNAPRRRLVRPRGQLDLGKLNLRLLLLTVSRCLFTHLLSTQASTYFDIGNPKNWPMASLATKGVQTFFFRI